MDIDDDIALRAHIRKLLLHYALKHLTIDYAEYTRVEVFQLLSDTLDLVSLDDPTSILLPIEPFDALNQAFKIGHQKAYDERWDIDVESQRFLDGVISTLCKPGKVPSKSCWEFADEMPPVDPGRPFAPVLTTQAIRQTPKLGSSASHESIKTSISMKSHLVDYAKIKTVIEQSIKEVTFSSLERDQILGVPPMLDSLDTEMRQAVTTLLATQIAGVQLPPKAPDAGEGHAPSMVSAFVRADSPPMPESWHHMSPPIFPSRKAPRTPLGPKKPSDIRALGITSDMTIEREPEDLATANMLLVDGWSVLTPLVTTSQNDTPTLRGGSQSSEVDELFALTPPQQSFLKPSNYFMDEILIPRSNKPGGGKKTNKLAEVEQSNLVTFLTPMLPPVPEVPDAHPPVTPSRTSPPVSVSMLGQPPSPSGSVPNASDSMLDFHKEDDVGLGALITKLCAPLGGQPAEDWILNERIEEKETLMMDVRILKDPHIHPPSPSCPTVPTSARALLCSKKNKEQPNIPNIEGPTVACLKKATGVQSLNIELTWRPFNVGTSIPSNEELIKVECHPELDFQDDPDPGHYVTEWNRIFDDCQVLAVEERLGASMLVDPAIDCSATLGKDCSQDGVVLTRAERRRLALHRDNGILDGTGGANYATEQETQSQPGDGIQSPIKPSKRRRRALNLTDDRAFISTDLGSNPELGSATIHSGNTTFSFYDLCSPKGNDLQSQTVSQSSSFWNDEASLDCDGIVFDGLGELMEPEIWKAENMDYHGTPTNRTSATEVSVPAIRATGVDNLEYNIDHDPPNVKPQLISAKPTVPSDPVQFSALSRPTESFHADIHRLDKITAQQSLSAFMKMFGKTTAELPVPPSSPPLAPEVLIDRPPTPPRGVPDELIDIDTITLPDDWSRPLSTYKYIASMELVQKTIMLSHLKSSKCNIELVEREVSETRGADLIVDVDTAIIYTSLAPLSITSDKLSEKISLLSWGYSKIVVVFEAFSPSTTYRRDRSGVTIAPYAFPPAIIKAVKKLKRTLVIMESIDPASGSTSKCREAVVKYGYARDVGDAARFARVVGDIVGCSEDRDWLTDEYGEDEKDLIQVRGMNVFAAASILYYTDLTTFVGMDPVERYDLFSCLVGKRRMAVLNAEIANRLAMVASSSPPDGDHESAVAQAHGNEDSMSGEPSGDCDGPYVRGVTKCDWRKADVHMFPRMGEQKEHLSY
ncbi:hypothetical protein BU17DRAFT_93162 [Hysterangium stoloniferum]|nr:hypothetical protein BU17DRAFT_93162 [Hysterangium stoloniferum]